MDHEDRLRLFREVARVGRPGGHFCFSSHNVRGLDRARSGLRRQLAIHPVRLARNLAKWFVLRDYNRGVDLGRFDALPYTVVRQLEYRWIMPTYYIQPEAQLEQLGSGFTGARVYSLSSGEEVADRRRLAALRDPWLYYVCTIGPAQPAQ